MRIPVMPKIERVLLWRRPVSDEFEGSGREHEQEPLPDPHAPLPSVNSEYQSRLIADYLGGEKRAARKRLVWALAAIAAVALTFAILAAALGGANHGS